jgi:hypothetical protein
MLEENHDREKLVLISKIVFPFDFVLGLILIIFAKTVQDILNIGHLEEPSFIRMAGVFTFFLGYLYFLSYRNPEKNFILFQVTLVLRGFLTISHFSEAQFLIGGALSLTHYAFYAMSFLDLIVFSAQIYFLRRMKKKWFLI